MFKFTVNTIRNRDNLSCEFDVETIDAAIQILNDQGENLALAFDTFHDQAVGADSEGTDVAETEGKPKRKRRTKEQIAADKAAAELAPPMPPVAVTPPPPVAVAPPPMPVPATVPAVKEGIEIPAFLDRTVEVPPPPPPAPAPPATELAQKVVEELKRRATGTPDGGKSIVDWLVAAGAVVKGATFEESLSIMLFLKADKLTPIATALGVQ